MIEYTTVEVGKGNYRISPSSLNTFISDPKEWLNSFEGNSSFKGNEASVYGTCVHYIFESLFDGRTKAKYFEDVTDYLNKELYNDVITGEELVNIKTRVTENYDELVDWYIYEDTSLVIKSELSVKAKLPSVFKAFPEQSPDYYVAGSIDAIVAYNDDKPTHTFYDKDCKEISRSSFLLAKSKGLPVSLTPLPSTNFGIRDYKTTKRAVKTLKDSRYLPQLFTYANAYNDSKDEVDPPVSFIEVVVIKGTKKVPVDISIVREDITEFYIKRLNMFLKDIVQTHSTMVRYPVLRPILFRDGVDFTGNPKLFSS